MVEVVVIFVIAVVVVSNCGRKQWSVACNCGGWRRNSGYGVKNDGGGGGGGGGDIFTHFPPLPPPPPPLNITTQLMKIVTKVFSVMLIINLE